MYRRILVATDGSELSQKAAHDGVALAKALGSELVALHVVPRYPASYFDGGESLSRQEVACTENKWVDHGQALVDAVCAAAQELGVTARGVVARSDLVAEAILSTARKHDCDLIVMASHGRRGIARILLGSETQQVLTHGSVPVLVLR